jgi:hypothetical protein
VRITLSVLVLLAAAAPSFADPLPRLRGTSPREASLIRELLERSSTARALANELESTDLIVYVQLTASEGAGRAATRLVTATDTARFLRIVMGAMTHPHDRAALLAHELQHVIEIGHAPEVRDIDSMRQLYRRIGEDRAARFSFETAEARAVGWRVRRELMDGDRARPDTSTDVAAMPGTPVSLAAAGTEDGVTAVGGCGRR